MKTLYAWVVGNGPEESYNKIRLQGRLIRERRKITNDKIGIAVVLNYLFFFNCVFCYFLDDNVILAKHLTTLHYRCSNQVGHSYILFCHFMCLSLKSVTDCNTRNVALTSFYIRNVVRQRKPLLSSSIKEQLCI